MKKLLEEGSDWPLDEVSTSDREADLDDALNFGNHKGAESQPVLLRELIVKDITHGYALPIPLSAIKQLPGAILAPMNIQRQDTINAEGQIIDKDRLTHDQSYEWPRGKSVNKRVDKTELLECRFGHCLNRLINWAVAARRLFPDSPILSQKVDFKSAYRRCHLSARTAVQTCTQLPAEDIAIIALRLTFGGTPCPFEWGAISETICDLALAILQHEDWDPLILHAPDQDLVPPTARLDDSAPFGAGRDLIVDVPVDPRGTADIYIDDIIGLSVDVEGSNNDLRLARAILLAIHVAARPKTQAEPIPRETMAALAKLIAEARPEEKKIILGWAFDFRRLIAALPVNKFVAWSKAISCILQRGASTAKELETNIGRLGHLGRIIPAVNHFLSRLRELQRRAHNRRTVKITNVCRADLQLMLNFLRKARDGIDLNIVAYRSPDHVYRSDSCPYGLGGYTHLGFAWRFYLPANIRFRASNNLLEHLACIITVWIEILAGRLRRGDCCLSMTDSTTSEGWSRRTNFKEDSEDPIQATVRIEVARSHAWRLLDHGIKDYSQWFPGRDNDVSDALSRDDDRSDEELTRVLKTFVPSQVPQDFNIVPLPNEISSWLTSLLLRLPVKTQLQEEHTRTKLGRGTAGCPTASPSASRMPTSTISAEDSESSSWEPLPWQCVTRDFRQHVMNPWLKAQSEVPSRMWLRPSGRTTDRTPPWMKTTSLADFYRGSSAGSRTRTQTPPSRKRSRSESSER